MMRRSSTPGPGLESVHKDPARAGWMSFTPQFRLLLPRSFPGTENPGAELGPANVPSHGLSTKQSNTSVMSWMGWVRHTVGSGRIRVFADLNPRQRPSGDNAWFTTLKRLPERPGL